jgi:hypothetical protein
MLRRVSRGRSPFHGGDREHLPQKLHWLGLSQVQTVLVLYALSASFGVLSLTLHSPATGPGPEKLFVMVGLAGLMLTVLIVVTALTERKERHDAARRAEPGVQGTRPVESDVTPVAAGQPGPADTSGRMAPVALCDRDPGEEAAAQGDAGDSFGR